MMKGPSLKLHSSVKAINVSTAQFRMHKHKAVVQVENDKAIKDASLVWTSIHDVSVKPHSRFGVPKSKQQILSPLTGGRCFSF